MRLIGCAFSMNPRSWRFGWCVPMIDPGLQAGPVDGDWWLCLGPLALMFEETA